MSKFLSMLSLLKLSFPGITMAKNLPASVGDAGDLCLILRSGRSPGGRNGNPLQYSYLERGKRKFHGQRNWQATVHGVAESDATEQAHMHFPIDLPVFLKSFFLT